MEQSVETITTKLTCPVCDRAEIAGNSCPNCDTDLSLIRLVAELPPSKGVNFDFRTVWLPAIIAMLIMVAGISLGVVGSMWIAGRSPTPTAVTSNNQQNQSQDHVNGFRYTVRRGDSLSIIAKQFYGNKDLWPVIVQANPTLQGRENSVEVGEVLVVPNIREDVPNNL